MGMSCDDVEPMIGFLLDNELDKAESQDIEEHLEMCDACRAILEEEGNLRDILRRAAASIDTPVSLRNRIHLTMERERRSQVGLARAWPAAVAAAILVSFIYRGANEPPPLALSQLSQAHARQVPMDVTSPDPQVVAHFLQTELSFAVPVERLASEMANQKPQQLAARIVDKEGHPAAFLRFDYASGSMALMVSVAAQAQAPGAQAQLGVSGAMMGAASGSRPRYVAHDAKGMTVAQWQTQGLVYDMVSDLPPAELKQQIEQLTR